ncbi:MAG TPA: ATP-dependent DNA helicase RecG [Burkholderiales bacterium]|nr:ATP-dependent DNA helicase RecG [Burkholderiales bacterium]
MATPAEKTAASKKGTTSGRPVARQNKSKTARTKESAVSEKAPATTAADSLAFATPAIQERLARLGVHRLTDLVLHLPLRYEDETALVPIAQAPAGTSVQVEGSVIDTRIEFRPRRQLLCRIEDASGTLTMRFFNFYPSQQKALAEGTRVRVIGEIRQAFFGAEMVHPRYRTLRGDVPLPDSLTPVYPTTSGLSQDSIRKTVARALRETELSETLPESTRKHLKLHSFEASVRLLHNPPPEVSAIALQERSHPAWQRLKFDELLAQQLSMRLHYQRRSRIRAQPLRKHGVLPRQLVDTLPFSLTNAQLRVLDEIRGDLARSQPMQRLLQGDVGSGKTIVSALAALQAIESGFQVAVMAPTEILAEQHYRKFLHWLKPLGIDVAWLSGSVRKKERERTLANLASGDIKLGVGTHALFQEQVVFRNLGLAIIDEQHRFGVRQRLMLRMKGGDEKTQPHQLMMSATPIPRTLAMSFYADLDVSVIDELPPGRTPVVTKLVADSRRDEVLTKVREACAGGSQAYWVCPLIEESEALQLQTAMDTYERLKREFPDLKTGLVHGRMRAAEKADVMNAYQSGQIQLLVATTVIEVGVDVPNASLMVIEHAERMGLSQLHQLRGRVGRGARSSACILLFQGPLSDIARERLRIIYENNDGFEVARLDLRLRGPGEILGARQSGVPMLRFADLERDIELLEAARDVAAVLVASRPDLVELHLARWLGGRQDYLRV